MELQGIGNYFAQRRFNTNSVIIDVPAALHFVQRVGIEHEDLVTNALGLYTIETNVKNGKVKFLLPTGEGYITKARPASCAWDPYAGITYDREEVTLCPHNIQVEHCTEEVPGLEGIFGQGNDVEDLVSTETGQRMFADLVEWIYSSMGSDAVKSSHFGKHPVVASAEASFTGSPELYSRIKNTLSICGGFLTMADQYKAQGEANFAVPIAPENTNGDKYTGNVIDLFNSVVAAQPKKLKALISKKRAKGVNPIMLVSGGIFDAYKTHLIDTHPAISDAWHFKLTAELCSRYGCVEGSFADDVLLWDGFWIKRMGIWDEVAADLEIIHHRVLLTVPGNFGIGLDVDSVPGNKGVGLKFDTSDQVKDAGKIYLATNYRMGTSILMKDLCVNASYLAA
ncbi:MAG: hypothetical protein HOP11_07500 [Saprospiraceae bacterium]|nr:hypothetical protein [Saprospiraceae bacterium]